jgi:hypothetical protein
VVLEHFPWQECVGQCFANCVVFFREKPKRAADIVDDFCVFFVATLCRNMVVYLSSLS